MVKVSVEPLTIDEKWTGGVWRHLYKIAYFKLQPNYVNFS